MASVVVIATGTVLAVTVPFVALKEIIEKRLQNNMKKHLGRRTRPCRINFGSVDDMYAEEYAKNKENNKNKMAMMTKETTNGGYSSDDDDRSSIASAPPTYEDLIHPPSYNDASVK